MSTKNTLAGMFFLAGICISAQAQSAATDICSDVAFRRGLMTSANKIEAYKNAGLSMVDLSDPRTIAMSKEPFKISCRFTVLDSDGENTRIRIDLSKNSLGDPILLIQPIE